MMHIPDISEPEAARESRAGCGERSLLQVGQKQAPSHIPDSNLKRGGGVPDRPILSDETAFQALSLLLQIAQPQLHV